MRDVDKKENLVKEIGAVGKAMGITRRELLIGVGATGFALAAGPVSANRITTSSEGLIAADITIRSGPDLIPAYEARPASQGRHPVILVIHEVFGLHEYIKDVTRRFAKEGYYALAPELYSREGEVGKLPDIQSVLAIVGRVPDRRVLMDLSAVAEHARGQSWARADRVGVTGFCWGGRMTWLFAAHEKHLKAAVAWYGALGPWRGRSDEAHPKSALDLAEQLHCPVLGLYGGADEGIPLSDIQAMEAKLKAHQKVGEIVVYPGAPHAFFTDYRASYRAEVAKAAWKQALGWFAKYLKA